MQTMIGALVQKASDIENEYEELRGKATDDGTDSVCAEVNEHCSGQG